MCRQPRNVRQTIFVVDRFPLPRVGPPIGGTSLTHVIMRLAAQSTTSPTPTAMGQSLIMILYIIYVFHGIDNVEYALTGR
jgi:hypothetical protein